MRHIEGWFLPRPVALIGLVLACLSVVLPSQPGHAAQGSGPTTAITGYADDSPAPPQFAQAGCLPAGGSEIPDPELPDGDFVLVGGGWGHGAGMSQYGAQGAARLGCTAEQILTTYYPGTEVSSAQQPDNIVIGLASEVGTVTLTAEAGPIPWELCHYQTGECSDLPVEQPQGAVWRVEVQPDATYRIVDAAGTEQFVGGDYELNLRAKLSPDPSVNRRAHVHNVGHSYRWGVVQIDSVQTGHPNAYLTLHIPDMDLYLRGLAEVPASWPAASLQSQAITGRSYALARINAIGIRDACRCHLYSTPRDQNYEGWDYEAADAAGGGKWVAAVGATSGQVLTYQGQIAETFYSSSHGGHSESTRFVFGGELPYAQAVDDSRWDLASSNPLRRWTVSLSAAQLGATAGVGQATEVIPLDPLGAGGRIGHPDRGWGGVEIRGTAGSVVWSGDSFKSRLGLRSTLVRVARQPNSPESQPGPEPQPDPEPDPEPAPPAAEGLPRLAGVNRITTAVEVSRHGWDAAEHVVIAAADRFPDALAGVALAASLGAPLLLSARDSLPAETQAEIERLGAGTAYLLGGSGAVSAEVRGDLADLGLITRRLSGATRFETAAAIADVASAGAADEVVLVPAGDWPDAVSASSLAALVDGPPVLLVERDRIDDATLAALTDLRADRVVLVGGTAVIGEQVEEELAERDLAVQRLAGGSRYATSVAVADEALRRRAEVGSIIAASGSGFADALSAGALAAREGSVLVLTPDETLDHAPDLEAFITEKGSALQAGVVVGGTAAVSEAVSTELASLLNG